MQTFEDVSDADQPAATLAPPPPVPANPTSAEPSHLERPTSSSSSATKITDDNGVQRTKKKVDYFDFRLHITSDHT